MEMPRKLRFSTPLLVGISMGLLLIAVVIFGLGIVLAPTQNQEQTFNSTAATNFGVVVNPGLEVVEVEPGGGAAKGGLQPGDKLEKVDGLPVVTPTEAMDKMRDKSMRDQSVTVTVRRKGQSLDLTLKPAPHQGRPGGPTVTAVPQNFGYF